MAQSSLVIKVKYGDTLRRFRALINKDQQVDLDMERLRTKICSLYNFAPDADFILTYIDEDNDQVTLAEDEDLYDAVRQGLNPVRMFVHLIVDKSAQTSGKSTGSSTPRGPPLQAHQNINPRVAEILKSVPEPLCDALSKLSLELTSKAATTPILADFINNISKVAQSFVNASPSPSVTSSVSGYEVNDNYKNASSREKDGIYVDEGIKADGIHVSSPEQPASMSSQVPVPHAVKGARLKYKSLRHPCLLLRKGKNPYSGHLRYMPMGDGIKKDKELIEDSNGKCENNLNATELPTGEFRKKEKGIMGDSTGSFVVNNAVDYFKACQEKQMEVHEDPLHKHVSCKKETDEVKPGVNKPAFGSYIVGASPFSGVPLLPTPGQAPYMPRFTEPSSRIPSYYGDGTGFIFHTGVNCDGCGEHPISGPRFMSKVRNGYDLCSVCFSRMGNDADYDRMDFPLPRHHRWTLNGCYNPMLGNLPAMRVPSMTRIDEAKSLRPRLDSHFVMDVNVFDGTLMAPSTPFTKIWRMHNNGTLPWPRGLQLIWIGGDRFNASDSIELEMPAEGVNVDISMDISVDFISPELPGRYISYWRMSHPTGHKFGQRVWVSIEVVASLEDSWDQSSRVNAGFPTQENSPIMDLNLPPGDTDSWAGECSHVTDLNLDTNVEAEGDSSSAPKTSRVNPTFDLRSGQKEGIPLLVEHHKRRVEMEEMNFPINNDLLVASNGSSSSSSSSVTSPSPFSAVESRISYPEIDAIFHREDRPTTHPTSFPLFPGNGAASAFPSVFADYDENDDKRESENDVEETLLKELKEMGFEEVDLNKEVLRGNGFDLERSVDELCGGVGWDSILEELKVMGFEDTKRNKKLLMKYNGSLTRVVMDLITGENQA